MKMLVYNIKQSEDENGVNLLEASVQWSEVNEEIVKRSAYNGEYTIIDDGVEEIQSPSQLDQIEAQVTYTAMITNTLIQ